ncbi:MAG TPA: RNA polymerase-binding protein DksA, partial [Ottowia sp.]|nr:RNA polymerase-binding protein DksA [Ottowia sp.]
MKTAAAKSPAPPKAKPAKATPSVVKPASKTQAPAPAASKTQAPAPAASKAGKPPVRSATTRASAAVTAPKITSARPPLPVPKNLPMPSVAIPPVPVPVKKDPKLANNWKTKSVEQLSDPEIIAMPDSEYMNDKQLAYFRHKLVQLKDDMLANAGQTAENLRDDTVVVPDPADRATIEEEHALELRTRDRERKLLKKIEQSIARI